MLDSRNNKSKIILAIFIATGVILIVSLNILLLGSTEAAEIIQANFVKIFIRLLMGVLVYSFIASYSIQLVNRYKLLRQSYKRWLVELGILVCSTLLMTGIEHLLREGGSNELPTPFIGHSAVTAGLNFVLGFSVFMIYEVWTVFEENRKLQVSLSIFEKEKIALQLATLQQKLNPHFLFNSLNVLSELIYEDIDAANKFIEQFSSVYRYVLEISDETFVSVQKELQFLDAYLFLQKIRFGDKLVVTKNLDSKILNDMIPPLSFQLLLENAIKHNVVSKQAPLHVEIYSEKDFLVVRNNLQVRMTTPSSSGVGHKNLRSTYALLSDREPIFQESNGEYIAKIPILKTIK